MIRKDRKSMDNREGDNVWQLLDSYELFNSALGY